MVCPRHRPKPLLLSRIRVAGAGDIGLLHFWISLSQAHTGLTSYTGADERRARIFPRGKRIRVSLPAAPIERGVGWVRPRAQRPAQLPPPRNNYQHKSSVACRDATGAEVTFFARQIQRLAPLGEPSGAYGDGLILVQLCLEDYTD